MEPDMDKCFLLLNQTFALAEFLSLNVVLGIETSSNQRRWSTNSKNFHYELISHQLCLRDNDVWLKSGIEVDQKVLEDEKLFNLTADCLTVVTAKNETETATGFSLRKHTNEELVATNDIKQESLECDGGEGTDCVAHTDMTTVIEEGEPSLSNDDSVSCTTKANFELTESGAGPFQGEDKRSSKVGRQFKVEFVDSVVPPNDDDDDDTSLSEECEANARKSAPEIVKESTEQHSQPDKEQYGNVRSIQADQCVLCDVTFASIEEGTCHYHQIHLQCVECGRKFSRLRALTAHVDNVHRGLKLYKCYFCEKMFGHTGIRSKHMKIDHHDQQPPNARSTVKSAPVQSAVKDEICPTLEKGISKGNDATADLITCRKKLCKDVFPSVDAETEHYKTIHCRCKLCDMQFRHDSYLTKHVNGVHKRLMSHSCKVCGARFRFSSVLSVHMRKKHTNLARQQRNHSGYRRVPCRKCELTFGSEKERLEHAKQTHTRCSICDMVFRSVRNLKMHVANVHEKLKPVKCPKCDFTCGRKDNLRIHDRHVHQKLKGFVCSYCGKAFSSNGQLNAHIKTVHTNERCHACTLCSKKFVFAGKLRRHMNKSHHCKECGEEFVLPKELRNHVLSRHTNDII